MTERGAEMVFIRSSEHYEMARHYARHLLAECTCAIPPKCLVINGTSHFTENSLLSYETLLDIAGETEGATAVYRVRNADGWEKKGSLIKGEIIEVFDDMKFTVVHTGNA